jgi:hypothetical protein
MLLRSAAPRTEPRVTPQHELQRCGPFLRVSTVVTIRIGSVSWPNGRRSWSFERNRTGALLPIQHKRSLRGYAARGLSDRARSSIIIRVRLR